MTRPRAQQVSVADTPYYHIVSRCVRRTFLCGHDHKTGRSYEHRRQWIEDRIRLLSSVFTIDLAAYAVMSNHYHLVVKLCPDQAAHWTTGDVLKRWTTLFSGPLLVQKYMNGETLRESEQNAVNVLAGLYRKRLTSLSWFMKCLNEAIAKEANREDNCTGHFWESRFKSQALLTDEDLLSCMAYVDLNPVRSAMAETPEASDHTSIKERINPSFDLAEAVKAQTEQAFLNRFDLALKPLLPFEEKITNEPQKGLLFNLNDYLDLVDFTGRAILPDKRGAISMREPPILERLGVHTEVWLELATAFEKNYQSRHSRRAHLKASA